MKSIWRGAISFGLIHIPIYLYSASRSRELKFKLLHKKDLSEIRYARMCKTEEKEVPWEEIVKGYEYEKGRFVVLSDEDFEKANLEKTKTIEVLNFAEEEEIDAIYFQTPYYLEPMKTAGKAYVLLREALNKSKKVAIVKFVFKNHEHLGIIKAHEDLLLLVQLRYDQELISAKDLNIPGKIAVPKEEMAIAMEFVDKLTKPFNMHQYTDTYTEEVKAIIKQKAKGKKIKTQKGPPAKAGKTQSLVALLKESLERETRKPVKKRRVA